MTTFTLTASGRVIQLLSGATSVTTSSAQHVTAADKTVMAKVTGTGAVSATVEIYGSTKNSTTEGVLLGTIVLSGTNSATDGFSTVAPWPFMWADLTAISGTGASVDVEIGV